MSDDFMLAWRRAEVFTNRSQSDHGLIVDAWDGHLGPANDERLGPVRIRVHVHKGGQLRVFLWSDLSGIASVELRTPTSNNAEREIEEKVEERVRSELLAQLRGVLDSDD